MCMHILVVQVTIVFTVVTKFTGIVPVTNDPAVTTAI